jgi:hypothetical protein
MTTLQTKNGFAVLLCYGTVIGVFPFSTWAELAAGLKERDLSDLCPEQPTIQVECFTHGGRTQYRAMIKTLEGYTDVMESLDLNLVVKRMSRKYPDAPVGEVK